MSIANYIFNKVSKECIYLGKKGVRSDFEFEGPLHFIGNKRYLLPVEYLSLLLERFRETGNEDDLIILGSDELLDTEDYLPEDEDLIEIGGENYLDLPLSKYLPELNEDNVIREIEEKGILIT